MLRILFRHFLLACLLVLFFWPKITFSSDVPSLKLPEDNASENINPKLSWEYNGQCPTDGKCFKVEVDNNSDFSTPEKSSYTDSTSYSPKGLSEGDWFWRVKARDQSGKWSGWSNIYKFSLQTTAPQASSPESSKKENSINIKFEIKDLKSEINSDEEIDVVVLLERDKPNSRFHIKGAFRKDDSINYFGETFFENNWSKNNSAYSRQPVIQTDNEGRWEGKIKVRADTEDSGFKEAGDYMFKVGKYTESGNGPIWSNEVNIKINYIQPSASPSPSPEKEEEAFEEVAIEEAVKPKPSFNSDYKIASVAGEATKSDNMAEDRSLVPEERKVNWLLLILGSGILISGIGYGLYQLKERIDAKNTNKHS